MIDGMDKLERFKVGDKEALVGTFSVNDDTDVPAMFESIWKHFREESVDNLIPMFMGIDVARDAFIHCFKSDDNFKQQSRQKKCAFLMAINVALGKAMRERELLIANGLSVFILWIVAMIQEDYEASKNIEDSFAKLRNKYDL